MTVAGMAAAGRCMYLGNIQGGGMSNKATGSGAPLPPVLGSSGGGPSWTINDVVVPVKRSEVGASSSGPLPVGPVPVRPGQ